MGELSLDISQVYNYLLANYQMGLYIFVGVLVIWHIFASVGTAGAARGMGKGLNAASFIPIVREFVYYPLAGAWGYVVSLLETVTWGMLLAGVLNGTILYSNRSYLLVCLLAYLGYVVASAVILGRLNTVARKGKYWGDIPKEERSTQIGSVLPALIAAAILPCLGWCVLAAQGKKAYKSVRDLIEHPEKYVSPQQQNIQNPSSSSVSGQQPLQQQPQVQSQQYQPSATPDPNQQLWNSKMGRPIKSYQNFSDSLTNQALSSSPSNIQRGRDGKPRPQPRR